MVDIIAIEIGLQEIIGLLMESRYVGGFKYTDPEIYSQIGR